MYTTHTRTHASAHCMELDQQQQQRVHPPICQQSNASLFKLPILLIISLQVRCSIEHITRSVFYGVQRRLPDAGGIWRLPLVHGPCVPGESVWRRFACCVWIFVLFFFSAVVVYTWRVHLYSARRRQQRLHTTTSYAIYLFECVCVCALIFQTNTHSNPLPSPSPPGENITNYHISPQARRLNSCTIFALFFARTVPTASVLGGPDLYVDKGSTINLTCAIRFSLEPPASLFWYHLEKVSVTPVFFGAVGRLHAADMCLELNGSALL